MPMRMILWRLIVQFRVVRALMRNRMPIVGIGAENEENPRYSSDCLGILWTICCRNDGSIVN